MDLPQMGDSHWANSRLVLTNRSGQAKVVVALGATAAEALFGRNFKVSRQRGEAVESELAPLATATVHPSSIVRVPDEDTRKKAMIGFVADLERIARS
jgi:uracil-DNA glycosylase